MVKLVTDTISDKLYKLLLDWVDEVNNNIEHDTDDYIAWNSLVQYLYELEKDKSK